jgi:predicted RNase H-like nuclease (RuvC/YqgF family)
MEYIQILEMLGTAIAASWLTKILTIRARVRQEKAGAAKAETEVKADQIDNIERLVEKAYKPTIETLENRVKELSWEVEQLRAGNAKILSRNEELEAQNATYRKIILELRPDLIPERPDRRGENAKSQPRNPDGTFAKEL